ncbi:MAG: formylglycine-generating enzyme family protein [Thermodesulfobacteriota bacterium]|nr:formylglycine-generating enzyme family protein [Thermodesulfobacteriota bacterium]
MKVNLLRILTIIASAFTLFAATPALSYVPDNLHFVPMGEGAVSSGQFAAPSGRTYTVPSINYKMVYISPGTFMMGSPSNEQKRYSDERQHRVTLKKGFYMGATEVTQKQWKAVMGNNPSKFKGDDLPVEQVSWNDCREFIRKLNRQEGGNKYRLPTEAEWEYACRAGSKTRFCFGASDSRLGDYAWYGSNSSSNTHPVSRKKPNAWELYDMHGNVWEWCQDWKGGYPSGHVTDPEGPPSGSDRVLRGGSWGSFAWYLRSADRRRSDPVSRDYNFGFRVVRVARAY